MRVCVPQLPQARELAPEHIWLPQVPHSQLVLQVCVPELPQLWLVVGVHTPSPLHADQLDHTPFLQVRVCVPQLPHASELGPLQVWPVQVPQWQSPPQVWVPELPHAWRSFGAQSPSPLHSDHDDHTPLSHTRWRVPQLPHASVSGPVQV